MSARSEFPKSKFPFLYLLTGDEFLRRKKINTLLQEFLSEESRETNLFRLYPDDVDWNYLLSQAKITPLIGLNQVFLFLQADRVKSGWENFETYLKSPAENSCFIFDADELPKSHVLFQWIEKKGLGVWRRYRSDRHAQVGNR